jgi:hypothetical protein
VADKNLRGRVTGLASQAVSNPVSRAAYGAAKGVTGAVTGAAVGALRGRTGGGDQGAKSADAGSDASLSTAQPAGAPAEDTLDSASSADDETTGGDAANDAANDADNDAASGGGSEPDVDLLPYPDLQEPVAVVEEVLASEAENGTPPGGHATEPHASTRDEDHGDAQLQRAEQAEIAEEVAEALPGGDLDLETPVGTTGADVGYNPDTAEADLQQPGTAPGVDPGLTSSVRKDEERGLAAAGGPDETS